MGKGWAGVACSRRGTVVPWELLGREGVFERKVRSFAKIAASVRMSAAISAGGDVVCSLLDKSLRDIIGKQVVSAI